MTESQWVFPSFWNCFKSQVPPTHRGSVNASTSDFTAEPFDPGASSPFSFALASNEEAPSPFVVSVVSALSSTATTEPTPPAPLSADLARNAKELLRGAMARWVLRGGRDKVEMGAGMGRGEENDAMDAMVVEWERENKKRRGRGGEILTCCGGLWEAVEILDLTKLGLGGGLGKEVWE